MGNPAHRRVGGWYASLGGARRPGDPNHRTRARRLAAPQERGHRGAKARRIHLCGSRFRLGTAAATRELHPVVPHIHPHQDWSKPMITSDLTGRVIAVTGKPMFVAEAGTGPAVVMLHGGGPGASGVSNYSRNIDTLATHFRVIVPDMPGYGRSVKRVDQRDPFGYLADMIRSMLDELSIDTAHLVGNSYGGAA